MAKKRKITQGSRQRRDRTWTPGKIRYRRRVRINGRKVAVVTRRP